MTSKPPVYTEGVAGRRWSARFSICQERRSTMPVAQETHKDKVLKIVEDLPADISYDDILKELAFVRMIDRGLADSKAGRTVTDEEAKRRIESWSA